jgi:general secretion pathway protein A
VLLAYDIEFEETDHVKLYKKFVEFIAREYRSGRRVVLIIDEAQNLSMNPLEDIRMLTNINIDKALELQLILVSQPELLVMLRKNELRQFSQRISADYNLEKLTFKETLLYINHRIKVAGGGPNLFAQTAYATVYNHSGGIPRVINAICDMSLVYAYAEGSTRIRKEIVLEAIRDRKVGGLVVRDDLGKNEAVENLRQ